MNYHRVVVQMLTLLLSPAGLGLAKMSTTFLQRAKASLTFLLACQDDVSGWMPNLGNNDGALFFPLSSSHYRDYRPALHALAAALGEHSPYKQAGVWEEEAAWWGLRSAPFLQQSPLAKSVFVADGYAAVKSNHGQTLTFVRSGAYKDRPAQADNLHLDLWHNGRNLLRDAGTYKYNTDATTIGHFAGAGGHNAPTLSHYDHMLKGPRFIWFNWTKEATLTATPDGRTIQASVVAFRHVTPEGIKVNRKITIDPTMPMWVVEDEIVDNRGLLFCQHWHPGEGYESILDIFAIDVDTGQPLDPEVENGYYSSYYGRKQEAPHLIFSSTGRRIKTTLLVTKELTNPLYPDQSLDE